MSEIEIPIPKWRDILANKWNSSSYSTYVIYGNIFDIFPYRKEGSDLISYGPLKGYLNNSVFKKRVDCSISYDICTGLTFADKESQAFFQNWVTTYDQVEKTGYGNELPSDFSKLFPILKRFFNKCVSDKKYIVFIIKYPETIIPDSPSGSLSQEEKMAMVGLLSFATDVLFKKYVGIILLTENISELQANVTRNPHIAQINIDLPNKDERLFFLQNSEWMNSVDIKVNSELDIDTLANRTSGLNITRIMGLISEAIGSKSKISFDYVARCKKVLIEEYCQGLIKFVEPDKKTLDMVATHTAAKKKLREIAWLFKNNRGDVLERGILIPGRVGVGKSFLVQCFASECGLPVMEIGDFRSKWVGDTEKQQSKILMTIKALGPVIVVVDEADAVFGNRSSSGDSGVSTRVFASFAAHIGDSTLRGRELWIAMTSRPDLMAIDMKRQGRFGLCIPLFECQKLEEIVELFSVVCKTNKISFTKEMEGILNNKLSDSPSNISDKLGGITGSEAESIVVRAKERAALDNRFEITVKDFEESISSFINPLDPNLLLAQKLAAIMACSDKRYLPERFIDMSKEDVYAMWAHSKSLLE